MDDGVRGNSPDADHTHGFLQPHERSHAPVTDPRTGSLNFILTNCLPRRWLTRLVGRFSKIEHPLVTVLGIALWKLFSDLDLSEARTTHFRSMHDCFTRQLKEGARPVDPDPQLLTSPSDGVVGAHGCVDRGR